MEITRKITAQKLIDYLNHLISLKDLVDWAECAMMESEFEEQDIEILREIVGRIGLADVKKFGLYWDDFESFLLRLGYHVKISVIPRVS